MLHYDELFIGGHLTANQGPFQNNNLFLHGLYCFFDVFLPLNLSSFKLLIRQGAGLLEVLLLMLAFAFGSFLELCLNFLRRNNLVVSLPALLQPACNIRGPLAGAVFAAATRSEFVGVYDHLE